MARNIGAILGGLGITGSAVAFLIGWASDVSVNKTNIQHLQENSTRVERRIDDMAKDVKSDFDKVNQKLDCIIQGKCSWKQE